jgi:hypothetical protein
MLILNNRAYEHDPSCRCEVQPEISHQITSGGERIFPIHRKNLILRDTKLHPDRSGNAAGKS